MKRVVAASHWILLFFGGLVVLGLLGTACRQLVGIDDRTTGGCGLGLADSDCASCIASSCCSAAESCGAVPACKRIEECYAGCAGDPTCVRGCNEQGSPGSLTVFATLEACIGTQCSAACDMSCGTRPAYAGPDAGEACRSCVEAKSCTEQTACSKDPICLATYACARSCSTVDCASACLPRDDAGAQEVQNITSKAASCATECALGQDWSCVGHVVWPQPTAAANAFSFTVQEAFSGTPISSAHVSLCPNLLDPACATPAAVGTTDDAGAVVLPYNVNLSAGGGFTGYVQLTGASIPTTWFSWGFPLTSKNADLQTVPVLSSFDVIAAYKLPMLAQEAGHGSVGVAVLDCAIAKAAGVQVALTPSDSSTKTFYYDTKAPGGYNPAATMTDLSGVALVANVPAGTVSLTVMSVATGQVISRLSFLVPDGGVAEVWALPTP